MKDGEPGWFFATTSRRHYLLAFQPSSGAALNQRLFSTPLPYSTVTDFARFLG